MTDVSVNTEQHPRQPVLSDDEGLTPGELEYASSGGRNVKGLAKEGVEVIEPTAPPPPAAPEPAAAAPQAPAPAVQAPPQQAEEEDEPDLDPKTGKPKTRGRWVAKQALDEAREEAKTLRQEREQQREQWARLEERFKVYQEALNAPDPEEIEQEEELPDPEQDIFGHLKALGPRLERRFAELESRFGNVHEETVRRTEEEQLLATYRQDAAAYMGRQPDFMDAYKFVVSQRDAELLAAGYQDPVQRQQLIIADEQALARKAFSERRSAAETVYNLAKARGYAPKPNGSAAGDGTIAAPPSTAPAAVPAPGAVTSPTVPAQPNVTEEIARLQKGQEAAMSLSNVGGNKPNNLTLQDLLAMPEDEFATFARKNPKLLEQMAGR